MAHYALCTFAAEQNLAVIWISQNGIKTLLDRIGMKRVAHSKSRTC